MRSFYQAKTDRSHCNSYEFKRLREDLEIGLRIDNAHAQYTNVTQ